MSIAHLRHQGAVVGSLLRLLASRYKGGPLPEAPGPIFHQELGPIPEGLVQAYQSFCGGDPLGLDLPAHLFPQWSFPLMVKVLQGVDLPLKRVLNQGCTLTLHEPIPRGAPLFLSAQLIALDVNTYRARLTQRITTGIAPGEERLVADVHSYFPLKRKPKSERRESPAPEVPHGLQEVGRFSGPSGSGFRYACLTGDLNPIHWIGPAARAAGFKAPILHGFATMAMAQECLERHSNTRLERLDIRFTRPFVMPGEARVLLSPEGHLQVLNQDDDLLMAGHGHFRTN